MSERLNEVVTVSEYELRLRIWRSERDASRKWAIEKAIAAGADQFSVSWVTEEILNLAHPKPENCEVGND